MPRSEGITATRAPVPAIVLGGAENAISVARSLARNGVGVFAVNYPYEAVRFSRYASYVHLKGGGSPRAWARFLTSPESNHLRGSVLLACSDEAISVILDNYAALSRRFRLEEGDPQMRRALLDKFSTYRLAQEAGIPTVNYWGVRSRDDLERAMAELRFPLMMKPVYSPDARLLKSADTLVAKAVLVSDKTDLFRRFSNAARLGVNTVLMDYVPGGDDRLCSSYTYLDEHGDPIVHLTKRHPRRYPRNSGGRHLSCH